MLLALVSVAALLFGLWPRHIHGVVTNANSPVAGATVRLRGSLTSVTTDAVGRFTLSFRGPALHKVVTAWKEGYYPAGADLTVAQGSGGSEQQGNGNLQLTLKPHPTADDPTYQWLTSNPDPNETLGCGHCMAAYDEWKLDAARAFCHQPSLSFHLQWHRPGWASRSRARFPPGLPAMTPATAPTAMRRPPPSPTTAKPT